MFLFRRLQRPKVNYKMAPELDFRFSQCIALLCAGLLSLVDDCELAHLRIDELPNWRSTACALNIESPRAWWRLPNASDYKFIGRSNGPNTFAKTSSSNRDHGLPSRVMFDLEMCFAFDGFRFIFCRLKTFHFWVNGYWLFTSLTTTT